MLVRKEVFKLFHIKRIFLIFLGNNVFFPPSYSLSQIHNFRHSYTETSSRVHKALSLCQWSSRCWRCQWCQSCRSCASPSWGLVLQTAWNCEDQGATNPRVSFSWSWLLCHKTFQPTQVTTCSSYCQHRWSSRPAVFQAGVGCQSRGASRTSNSSQEGSSSQPQKQEDRTE